MVLYLCFQRERKGPRKRLPLLRREVHGPRVDDHVAECRPDGR